MYVCICEAVTEREVRRAIDDGAVTAQQLRDRLNVGGCCGQCADRVEECLASRTARDLAHRGLFADPVPG